MTQVSRRSLITGLISLVAAPAIVRVASVMPVKALPVVITRHDVMAYMVAEADLQAVVRRAFVPRLYVQLWQSSPLLGSLQINGYLEYGEL